MASTIVAPHAVSRPAEAPAANATADKREERMRLVQYGLFIAGAVLMPLGILAIMLGWYGVAHTKYQYNQLPYVVSGGLLGLGLVFLGGFLYFGAWLARVATEQRESSRQMADAILALADLVAHQPGNPGTDAVIAASGATLVLAGTGSTVHRRDCALISHRDDLHEITGSESDLGVCRVCRPTLP